MDPRLLRLYSDELSHLREVGAEFAREFPKIAARLGVEGMEVHRSLCRAPARGLRLPAARVQLKLESEQPRLIAHLLEATYPNFLAPLPSMMVARFGVDPADPNLRSGHAVPRGSALFSEIARGQDTHCEFTTAHEVILWPIELASVQYFSFAPGPRRREAAPARSARAAACAFACAAAAAFASISSALDRLSFYISALGRRRVPAPRARARRHQRRRSCAATRQAAPASPARRSGAAARAFDRSASAPTKRCCPNRCARSPAIACCRRSPRCRSGCSSSRSAISPIACAGSRATRSRSSCCSTAATRRSKQ